VPQWKAGGSIVATLDVKQKPLRVLLRRAQAGDGAGSDGTTDERSRVKVCGREAKELRRADEILKAASN
jgi:predicted Abi (CAAX) family protease